MLAAAEDVAGARILLQPQPVDVASVGDFDDLIDAHDVAADTGDAGVGLVVDEDVAAVVGAVGEGDVGMVGVAVEEDAVLGLERFGLGQQPLGKDALGLVGLAPAGGRAAVEHRNADQLAHRRQADDADLARLAAAVEAVIFVEIARLDLGLVGAGGRLGDAAAAAQGHPADHAGSGQTGHRRHGCGSSQEITPAHTGLGLRVLRHSRHSSDCQQVDCHDRAGRLGKPANSGPRASRA